MTFDLAQMIADREAGTPGEWFINGPTWNQIVWTDNETRLCFMTHSNGLNDARDEANARRIASVPLFEAEIIRLTARVAELEVVEQSKAARDVIAERHRQIDGEGWTPDHDDAYFPGKLAQAGACYAMNAGAPFFANRPPSGWPFTTKWWKPTTPRRDLVKAAALILAEIERLDRTALSTPTEEPKT